MNRKLPALFIAAVVVTTPAAATRADDRPPGLRAEDRLILLDRSPSVNQKTPGLKLVADVADVTLALEADHHPVTYLGVTNQPVPGSLRAHLDLPDGFGLLIEHVMPESPAAKAGIQVNDVFVKLDDQHLVNGEQLSALVRAKAEGETVSISLIRKGRPITLDAELAKKVMPLGRANRLPGFLHLLNDDAPHGTIRLRGPGVPGGPHPHDPAESIMNIKKLRDSLKALKHYEKTDIEKLRRNLEDFEIEIDHLLRSSEHPKEGQPRKVKVVRVLIDREAKGGSEPARIILLDGDNEGKAASKRIAKFDDGKHWLTLSVEQDGRRLLLAKDAEGHTLYEGPVDTDGQIEAVPPAVREKLLKLANETEIDLPR